FQFLRASQKFISGDLGGALRMSENVRVLMDGNPEMRAWAVMPLANSCGFAAAMGDWTLAEQLRARIDVPNESILPFMPFVVANIDAILALHRGEAQAAAERLRPLLKPSADSDGLGAHTHIRITLAQAEQQLRNPDAAWPV